MTDVVKRNGPGAGKMTGADAMDRLFREADFAAENPGLDTGLLWQTFWEKIKKRESAIENGALSREILAKAMRCNTAGELLALAKSYGKNITRGEAEAYLAELDDCELDGDLLRNVAGGGDSYKKGSGGEK
jgi:hypothetical protein